jgi:chromosome segregation ATPase
VDVDAIVANLAERDRWKARLGALQKELRGLRTQRTRLEGQLQRLARELKRLETMSSDLVRTAPRNTSGEAGGHGSVSPFRAIR